jgi:ABC-type multidrug transport system ATPase subunit
LTAKEHLRIFSYLKNLPAALVAKEIDEKLKLVGLSDVRGNKQKPNIRLINKRLPITMLARSLEE